MIVLLLVIPLVIACGGSSVPIAELLDQIGCEGCPKVQLKRGVEKDWDVGTNYAVTACINREGESTVWLWSAYETRSFTDELVIVNFQRGPTWMTIRDSEDKCFLMNATYEGVLPYVTSQFRITSGTTVEHATFVVNEFVEIEKGQHDRGEILRD